MAWSSSWWRKWSPPTGVSAAPWPSKPACSKMKPPPSSPPTLSIALPIPSGGNARHPSPTEPRLLKNEAAPQQSSASLDRLAKAFDNLAAKPSLGLIHRYQTRLHLNYQRTLYNILLLRAVTVPSEPSPISEHSGTGPLACREPVTKENQP